MVRGEHAGEYYTLDDAGRRRIGVPRVERNTYARETGAVAVGLLAWSDASGDEAARERALAALRWALAKRALPGGGYAHGAADAASPYLGDSLALGWALLAAYRSTGERHWLMHALATAGFIEQRFRAESGYASAVRGATPIAPLPEIDENIALARFANLLARYSGDEGAAQMARHPLGGLAAPSVAPSRVTEAGVRLAERALNAEQWHRAVTGTQCDLAAAARYRAARRLPSRYKRLDGWDRSERPLPNPDVAYPKLGRAAAFVCTEQRCSLPIFEPDAIASFLAER